MKRIFISIILLLLINSCSQKKSIPELLAGKFFLHAVTFDEKTLKLNLEEGKLKDLLVLLHHKIEEKEIKEYLGLSDTLWNEKINYLFGLGLLKKKEDGSFSPTFFILDSDNYTALRKFTDSLGREMSGIAIDRLEKIKQASNLVPSLKNISFNSISLFIMGAVMHDVWQTKFYQDKFIKSFIPKRGNQEFYLAYFQAMDANLSNSFWEAQLFDYPTFKVGNYYSNSTENILSKFQTPVLVADFGMNPTEGDSVFIGKLIIDLIKLNRTPNYKVNAKRMEGFKKYGMILNNKPTMPIISVLDNQKLYELAGVITEDIVNYFNNRQAQFIKRYLNSQYREEVNYKEWMVWIYKLISSKTIDELITQRIIIPPKEKSIFFILEK